MTPTPTPRAATAASPDAPAAYPMVAPDEATGRVRMVYAEILDRFPMVPSLFQSLALSPGYLELAWDQTLGVLGTETLADAASGLVRRVRDAVPPHPDPDVRDVLADFVQPLATMSLVTAGLLGALDGRIHGPPARPADTASPPTDRLVPDLDVPVTETLDRDLVGTIRRDLGTPLVNSIWRVAADRGVLADAWRHLGPLAREPSVRQRAVALQTHLAPTAMDLAWSRVASVDALQVQGLADAAPGTSAVLRTYLVTLPRVLVLVAGSPQDT